MKSIVLLLSFILALSTVSAQKPIQYTISFPNATHEFGKNVFNVYKLEKHDGTSESR